FIFETVFVESPRCWILRFVIKIKFRVFWKKVRKGLFPSKDAESTKLFISLLSCMHVASDCAGA
ncbi:15178_t:CDS:2, partial [Dentiscutata erythropus]